MLVLTRKLMEKLYIGEDICVTVVRLDGGQVRLGIDAPREVAVVRAELVPEREQEHERQLQLQRTKLNNTPILRGPLAGRSEVRTPSPVLAHESDSRRRGR